MELTQLRIVWGRAVAHLHGVVDWNAAADFAGMAVVADAEEIAVDLERVTSIDLAGLTLLVDLASRPNVTIVNAPGPEAFLFGAHP